MIPSPLNPRRTPAARPTRCAAALDLNTRSALWRLLPLVALLLAGGTSACRSAAGSSTAPDWVQGACLKHDDCARDELCVRAQCVPASDDLAVDLSGVLASQWFTADDGACRYDHECGPWVCFSGACTSPDEANRRLLPASNYRYWDTSCVSASDCGPWLCADGWCTQPGFVSQHARLPDVTPPGLDECLADTECGEGADCVFPGYCYPDVADDPMTFVELGALTWYADPDGACDSDTECGPHACVDNWCVAQDLTDRPRPPRSNFLYYDASCSFDASCGDWICQNGFCQDPDFAPASGQGASSNVIDVFDVTGDQGQALINALEDAANSDPNLRGVGEGGGGTLDAEP